MDTNKYLNLARAYPNLSIGQIIDEADELTAMLPPTSEPQTIRLVTGETVSWVTDSNGETYLTD